MTYLDELLTLEEDGKREVEYIPLAADDDCSHEIKRRLLLGRKAIT